LFVTHAVLELRPLAAGGLKSGVVRETRSLLLIFGEPLRPQGPHVFGARLVLQEKETAVAGDVNVRARLEFWADEAAKYAVPKASFSLWYAGRIVGSGMVHGDEVDGPAAPPVLT
jgi:hypothetical protein